MPLPAIDVLIPAIEKDLGTLPRVIDSVRAMVRHPIGRILIVAPDTPRMRKLCADRRCSFINERSVLPITKSDIRYRSARWERSGWLYQQLLKLGGAKLVSASHYLVIDADTVLIRPHRFLTPKGKTIFYTRNWSQPEYFVTYRKLLGREPARTSFVTHYMLFETAKVRRLKQTIEARHGKSWYRAILSSMNLNKQFAFSEFETYANYHLSSSPGRQILKPARNRSLSLRPSELSSKSVRQFAARYRSLSFHQRKVYAR